MYLKKIVFSLKASYVNVKKWLRHRARNTQHLVYNITVNVGLANIQLSTSSCVHKSLHRASTRNTHNVCSRVMGMLPCVLVLLIQLRCTLTVGLICFSQSRFLFLKKTFVFHDAVPYLEAVHLLVYFQQYALYPDDDFLHIFLIQCMFQK